MWMVLLPALGLAAVQCPAQQAIAEDFYSKLTTLDGRSYDRATVKAVEPDGLTIQYTPEPGGIGLAKLKFRNLPESLQKKYSYDPRRATNFEKEKAQNQAQWLATIRAEEAAVASNALILDRILAEYCKTNTRVGEGVFFSAESAIAVWDMVTAKGLPAKLQIGNVHQNIASPSDIDHAWVMAAVSPGNWLALDPVAQKVVYRQQNERYYSGYAFPAPDELNVSLSLLGEYQAAAVRRQQAVDDYNQTMAQWNAAGGYAQSGLRADLDRAAAEVDQRAADLDQVGEKLTALLTKEK
jgi:hypothetical protein